MYDAKLDMLVDKQDWMSFMLASCSPTLLSSTPQGRAEVISATALRVDSLAKQHALSSPLHIAAFFNDLDSVQDLVASQTFKSNSPIPILQVCACVGSLEVAEKLIESKVVGAEDVNAYSLLHVTPLHKAATYGHEQVVHWLLRLGARVDSCKLAPNVSAGQTALHCAALQGHTACCELLLHHRADVGACDTEGTTPLRAAVTRPVHMAGSRDPEATAKVLGLLLSARADPSTSARSGWATLLGHITRNRCEAKKRC